MKNKAPNELHTLFWEATLRCNAYCKFCGSRCGDDSAEALRREEVSLEIICNCFKKIAEVYDSKGIMINVTGGEALLRNDLFEVMSYASDLGFPWGLVTNGSLIDQFVVEKMKVARMKTISISLDGVSETHNAIRNIPDGFEKIQKAVGLLKKADFLDELQITTVVNHKNIHELESLYAILQEWGINSWRLAMIDPIGRAKEERELLLTKSDYQEYFEFFKVHQFDGKIMLVTSCSHYLGTYDNLYREHRFSCVTGRHVGSILANGDIYVCPNVPRIPELIQGNIKKDSFTDIWENGFQWFRNPDRQRVGQCEACKYYELCKGDSLHTWDFSAKRPRICFKEQDFGKSSGSLEAEEKIRERLLAYYPKMRGIRISYKSSSESKVLFTPSATKQLLTYFEWGEVSSKNCFELLAGLAGFTLENLIVVEHLIPVTLEDRNETTAMFSDDNYQKLLKEVSILNIGRCSSHKKYKLSDSYSLVGIAHTHPLELSSILSIPDIELHGKMQKNHGKFVSLILNPQKKQIAAYYNSVFTPVDVELLIEKSDGLYHF